jgi:hypothetical protein
MPFTTSAEHATYGLWGISQRLFGERNSVRLLLQQFTFFVNLALARGQRTSNPPLSRAVSVKSVRLALLQYFLTSKH